MNGPTDDYLHVIIVPPFQLHESSGFARTNQSREPQNDTAPDYKGLVTMSGSRVDERQQGRSHPLLRWPGQTNRDPRSSSLHLRARR